MSAGPIPCWKSIDIGFGTCGCKTLCQMALDAMANIPPKKEDESILNRICLGWENDCHCPECMIIDSLDWDQDV